MVTFRKLFMLWQLAYKSGDVGGCRQIEAIVARAYSPHTLQVFLSRVARWSFTFDDQALASMERGELR